MTERAFGWVQDPGDLRKLRRVVEVFCPDSEFHAEMKNSTIPRLIIAKDGRDDMLVAMSRRPLRLSYKHLVGTAFKPRSSARCDGIIQAAILGQKRDFIGNWPADNFVRWAHALGFISWDEKDDDFQATKSGVCLSETKVGSEEEYHVLADAMLSYPPAVRVIHLLAEAAETASDGKDAGLTKFDIGRQLGFQGEKGFTTISQNHLVREFCHASPDERKKIKANWEGSANKYARMICAWLGNLKQPWVRKEIRGFSPDGGGQGECPLAVYYLTAEGFVERRKTMGMSSHRKISKHLPAAMLCPNAPGRAILRRRRARIVEAILQRGRSIVEIEGILAKDKITQLRSAVESDLAGLENIGLSIEENNGVFRCRDKIHGLKIPRPVAQVPKEEKILDMTERCGSQLREIPRDFLVLIDMAFDGSNSMLFEVKIAELLIEYCGFKGGHLGGGSRPDGAFYSGDWGMIVDAKSYKEGFNIPVSERDKMLRYLLDLHNRPQTNKTRWWEIFPDDMREFLFMFVSGEFGGGFRDQLRKISENAQHALGAAVSASALLLLAEKIARKEMSHQDFKRRISSLDEADLRGCE